MLISPEEIRRILKADFVSFLERSFYELNPQGKLVISNYIETMAYFLEECRLGNIKRLIINLPPRHLKSHCATICFTAWLLGHSPSKNIICVSYNQELSEKMARDTKALMSSSWYQSLFATRISPDRQATADFSTTKNGNRLSTSTGGQLTGRGGDIIIIDDPMKPDEALSDVRRKAVHEWYDGTLASRLNSKTDGCIIIVMQRLHQDDLVGHVLEQEPWTVLPLPAIAEDYQEFLIKSIWGERIYQRQPGDILDPQRESLATLNNIRSTLGEYHFNSQYLQNPMPVGGAFLKLGWIKYYSPEERPANLDFVFQSWDTANKASEFNDYSVCTTWGKKGKHYYLLNVFRRRMEYPELKRSVKEQADIYRPMTVLIEDKASGTQLIQEIRNEGLWIVKAYNPGGNDKTMRFIAQTAAFENGLVWLPSNAHWLADYIKELTTFPGCKHDDQVDSTAQALAWAQNRKIGFFS